MAVAGIIAAAVGVMLLIVVGYVVVGATITTAETVTNAQKDVTLQNEIRLGTAIVITDPLQSSSILPRMLPTPVLKSSVISDIWM